MLMISGLFSANAQDVRVGMQMSPTISFVSTDGDYLDKVNRIKFSWGFVTLFNTEGRNYSVMTGVDITTKGAKFSYEDGEGNEYEVKYNTQHLEIPLAIRMHTREIGYFSYWLKAGLAPSIELKEKVDFHLNDEPYEIKGDNFSKNFGLNLLLGIGTQYEISEETDLFFGLGYNNGLLNSFTKLEGYKEDGFFSHFALQAGVLF